jgi:hypothetical protein
MREIDDMETVATFYAKAMMHFVQLMGISKPPREERVVFDNQIAKGNTNWFMIHEFCIILKNNKFS